MAHSIKSSFINELKTGTLKEILKYVQHDDSLDMELRGDKVIIYYRGGALLTIHEDTYSIDPLAKEYHKGFTIATPTTSDYEDYIPKAKHIIDVFVYDVKNHLWEKDIQQQVVKENNYSRNAKDTDYYIIDIEYQDTGRFDIVAIRWDSKGSVRKLPKSFKPVITVFEVKQGVNSITGKSGMMSHITDFEKFTKSTSKISDFKDDMIKVFNQKRELGLIVDMDNYKEVKVVADEIEFVFLIANYKSQSKNLKNELSKIDNCKFIYANAMGYGLYQKNIIDKNQFAKLFL